ncbi:MAG: VanW family protein [Deltaproteobacteria bacterium]|nr:VanW family protein [Deltaproteobacteria bacterium]
MEPPADDTAAIEDAARAPDDTAAGDAPDDTAAGDAPDASSVDASPAPAPRAPAGVLRKALVTLLFAAAGGAIGFLLLPERQPQAAGHVAVRVAGKPVTLHGDLGALTLELARAYLGETITLRVGDTRRVMTREHLGVEVDVGHLQRLLGEANDPLSELRLIHQQELPGRVLDIPMPAAIEGDRAMLLLMQLKDDFDVEPQNAHVDTQSRALVPERPGRRVDVYGTLSMLDALMPTGGREVEVPLVRLAPDRTAEQLRGAEMRTSLGFFETRYNPSVEYRDREFNLQLAASRLDGQVVLPGETFDFNGTVGDRSEARGFRTANVIAGGELVDGIGGGTCQISGTLHAAVFFAGLEIVHREPHTRPSGYIKLGLDATVVYPSINFLFRNNLPFPIVISFRVQDGIARAEIWGQRRTRTVTFVRRIESVIPFRERTVEDSRIPVGTRVLSQRGIPGFRVRRYRVIREGDQAVRERMNDTYPPTAQIWRVGTRTEPLDEDDEVPRDDQHPEYVADELLTMTQGPGIEGIQEHRDAGRTGVAGWTVAEGFATALFGTQTEARRAAVAAAREARTSGASAARPGAAPVRAAGAAARPGAAATRPASTPARPAGATARPGAAR